MLRQSVWQWAWTVTIGASLFGVLERRVARLRAGGILAAGHVVPTVLVAGWAALTERNQVMSAPDYGTSCLIMTAGSALLMLTGSRVLRVVTVLTFAVDAIINGPVTLAEHVMALVLGAIAAACIGRRLRSHPVDWGPRHGPCMKRGSRGDVAAGSQLASQGVGTATVTPRAPSLDRPYENGRCSTR